MHHLFCFCVGHRDSGGVAQAGDGGGAGELQGRDGGCEHVPRRGDIQEGCQAPTNRRRQGLRWPDGVARYVSTAS